MSWQKIVKSWLFGSWQTLCMLIIILTIKGMKKELSTVYMDGVL